MTFLIRDSAVFQNAYKNIYPAADGEGGYVEMTYEQFKQEVMQEQNDRLVYCVDVYNATMKQNSES